ncbi:MAG: hypothetical protein AB1705_04320 [Verrucomicrobiota bacterium]
MMNRLHVLAAELDGHVALGHERHAVRLAGRILASRRVTESGFCSAVDALLACADRLEPWRRRVERAYERLGAANDSEAARRLFYLYVSLARWTDAGRFLPARLDTPRDLLLAIWTLLHLRRVDEAGVLARRCERFPVEHADETDVSCLVEALACHAAQTRRWDIAQHLWESGRYLSPFDVNAVDGLVKLHALRALLAASEMLGNTTDELAAFERGREPESMEDLLATLQTEADFKKKALHLAKVIPAEERWRFGV